MSERFTLPLADARHDERRPLCLPITAFASEGAQNVVVHNISRTGLLIQTTLALTAGEHIVVDLPEAGSVPASVMWSGGEFHGCSFATPISRAELSAVRLRSPVDRVASSAISAAETEPDFRTVDSEVEPDPARLPLRTRLWAIIGLALAAWGLMALGGVAVYALI